MLLNGLKIFIYHFKQNKLFSILNILGLSIGIAGVLFSILYRNHEMQFDAWNPYKKEVHQVFGNMGDAGIWPTSPEPLAPIALETIPEIESYSYFRNNYSSNVLEYKGKKTIVSDCFNADDKIFEMFPFEFIEGDPKGALKDRTSVVISDELASELFGVEKNLVGKSIRINNSDWTVKGVYHISGPSSVAPKLIFNGMIRDLEYNKGQWGNFNFGLVFKLKENVDKEVVEKKIENIYFEYRTKFWAKEEGISVEEYIKLYGQVKIILQPLETAYLHGVVSGYPEGKGNYQLLVIMFGISTLILILSLVNYINLATANAIRRAKEVGVRKIVGANKSDIIKQFVFETSITALIAIILSLAITELTLPYYNDFVNRDLSLNGSLFFMQLVVVFILVVIFAGILPAVYVANFEALKVLKGNFSRSKSGIWLRNSMLVLQFAIASLFIVGSYIVYQQVDFISNKDLGFKGDQVIRVKYRQHQNQDLYKKYLTFKNELLKMEGVEGVAAGTFEMGAGANSSSSFSHERKSTQAQNMAMDFGMLDVLNVKILEGRNLSEKFASDSLSTMLVNKQFVEKLQLKNPVGTVITTGWGRGDDTDGTLDLEIVGVVDDFNLYGLQSEIPPMVFLHNTTVPWMVTNINSVYIKVSKDDMAKTIANLEKFWTKNVDQDYPFTYEFVDKLFANTYKEYVKQKKLFFVLNAIVILIALFGLFALASFSIQRRMKEIAIRKTLGAETKTLLTNLSKQYIIFCAIGFLISLFPTYLIIQKWLSNFSFRIDISWIPFVIGFLALLALTLLIVLAKAYQATKLDVLKYLKYE
jgi:putative ABC transport system permease protein